MDLTEQIQQPDRELERQLDALAREVAEQIAVAGLEAARELARRERASPRSPDGDEVGAAVTAEPSHGSEAAQAAAPTRPPQSTWPLEPAPAPEPARSPGPVSGPAADVPRRRGRGELAGLRDRLVEHVRQQPGRTADELGRELAASSDVVALSLRTLVARGMVRTDGEASSARFYPATRGWATSTVRRGR